MFFRSTPADWSQNRVVGTVTMLWARYFSWLKIFWPALGPIQPLIHWVLGFFPRIRQLDYEVGHSPSSTADVRNKWSYISAPYLPLWCGQEQHYMYILPLLSSSVGPALYGFINPYPTAFPYGNGMVLHFYQQKESSTTKTVHKVINKGLKTYV